ncbi:hypothetical protein LTR36_003486 [Oleoguttula mirabilis]|uniref:Lipase n=1 Tax=Oleoguttula mirabilis TaxID=1507867 RepID=A0AAV9JIU3_9PEZI|nr:hypothetical protein LTR36_003486 [Oleoguttula mirabilis]
MYSPLSSLTFAALTAIAVLCVAIPTPSSVPLPPSQDPWYTTPAGFEDALPGEVLRLRSAPGNITTIYNNSAAAYNILYRTTDSTYNASWAVTTLFVPKHTNGSALLSYQIPYNTPDVDGSPSYSLYAPGNSYSDVAELDMQTALSLGWYLNVPDYEGPLAAFGLGVQEGHATLDSVRAVLNTGFGLAGNAPFAMWGYSGGSLATGWAAELQVQYAHELNFAGVALGGLVANVTSIWYNASEQWWSGLLPLGILGLTKQYPAAYDYLISQLKTSGPYNRTGFLAGEHMTVEEAFAVYADQPIYEYFINGSASVEAPIFQAIYNSNGYLGYHGVPQMPLFFYKATQDELAPVADTDAVVARYCEVGANILYERNTVGGHLDEETNGDARAFAWLQSVLSGTYEHEGCTIRDVAINVTDTAL